MGSGCRRPRCGDLAGWCCGGRALGDGAKSARPSMHSFRLCRRRGILPRADPLTSAATRVPGIERGRATALTPSARAGGRLLPIAGAFSWQAAEIRHLGLLHYNPVRACRSRRECCVEVDIESRIQREMILEDIDHVNVVVPLEVDLAEVNRHVRTRRDLVVQRS